MDRQTENILYFKAGTCYDSLKLAIETFKEYLKAEVPASDPSYYKARNYLRDGEKFFQEALKEAKRLLGPLPAYSSPDFEKWRADFLSQHKILTSGQEFEALKEELLTDEQLGLWLSQEDIARLLLKNYESQRSGKRKLSNIKGRIILDGLSELLGRSQQLKKAAMEKLQRGG